MSKQRQRALKHPRVIAWEQVGEFAWRSEELPFNYKPIKLRIQHYSDGFRFQVRFEMPDGLIIDTGGPHDTLAGAQQAADMWYRNARSR